MKCCRGRTQPQPPLYGSIGELPPKKLFVVHRHFISANRMHHLFHLERRKRLRKGERKPRAGLYLLEPEGFYLSAWYAFLFATLEGLQKMSVDLHSLTAYDDEMFGSLRRFRNAVFHTPKSYWEPRHQAFFKKYGYGLESKIHRLSSELDAQFFAALKAII